MKKLIVGLLSVVLMLGVVNAEEKVKVYMFEAGGCPYCEAEEEYLKGLSSYGKKFELIKKELYVDHVDWKQGKDYKLGKEVAEQFLAAGFENASYQGTPFVIISDIYAVAGYDTDLEKVINQAYEEGDRDAVTCISKGETNCIRSSENTEKKEESKSSGVVIAIISGVLLIGAMLYVLKNKDNSYEDEEVKPKKEEVKKEEIKKEKTPVKKTTAKKTKSKSKKK